MKVDKNPSYLVVKTLLLATLMVISVILSSQKLFAQEYLNMASIDLLDAYYDSYLGEYNRYVDYYSSDVKGASNYHKMNKYSSDNLFDGNFNTCWVAGSYKTKSYDTLYVSIPKEIDLDKVILNIFSGYGKSKTLYYQNARPKKIKISLYAAYNPEGYATEVVAKYFIKKYSAMIIELKDTVGVQSFPLKLNKQKLIDFQKNNVSEAISSAKSLAKRFLGDENSAIKIRDTSFVLKIEILDVYQGTKYDDVCISELFFNNRLVTHSRLKDNKVVNVYIKNDHTLLADYANEKAVVIYQDTSSTFTMIDWLQNTNFAILHYVKNDEVGPGRTEEHYSLIDLKNKNIVDKEFARCTGHSPIYGFMEEKGEKLYIENIGKYDIELR